MKPLTVVYVAFSYSILQELWLVFLGGTNSKSLRLCHGRLFQLVCVSIFVIHTRHLSRTSTYMLQLVKLEDPVTGIACDINVNDQLGLYNTKMIAKYCEYYPLLTPLLRAIKAWAKSFGLNDSSGSGGTSTFSSYSLTLLTIGLLQVTACLVLADDAID